MQYEPSAPLSMIALTCFIVLWFLKQQGLLYPYLLFDFCTCSVLYLLALVATNLDEIVFVGVAVDVVAATVAFELPTVADSQFLQFAPFHCCCSFDYAAKVLHFRDIYKYFCTFSAFLYCILIVFL